MKKTMTVQARAPYDELHLKLFRARTETHLMEQEKKEVAALLAESRAEVQSLLETERIRIEKRNAAWRFAGHLVLMGLFAFGCTTSAAACVSYGPWWTGIAPVLLLLMGLKEALKS